ncbi:lysozyme family protein [Sporosarcina sp. BP05]|uniref:lysozyme family protein n=1 Tax=Sporosarcina sp. BP05 TaxID=2758726 RepID=UPI00164719A0|nr:lysozyme family protein [Sporosarcina sp. BP05]
MGNSKEVLKTGSSLLLKKLLASSVGLVIVAIALVVIIIIGVISGSDGNGNGALIGGKALPESVMQWEGEVLEAMERHGVDESQVLLLLAIMNQESQGDIFYSNGDIFQSSESKCGYIGCITDPIESIDQAVKYFKGVLAKGESLGVDIQTMIQSYNFGGAYMDFIASNGGEHSEDLAKDFSMIQVQKDPSYNCNGNTENFRYPYCYGDFTYVGKVMAYVSDGNMVGDLENFGDFVAPVSPMVLTSGFGGRDSPIEGASTNHKGQDLDCTLGVSPIHTVKSGVVTHAGTAGGLGNAVVVLHGDDIYTTYGHMSSLTVSNGDEVEQGEQIGVCGSTGVSSGAHLHFEINVGGMWGNQIDPYPYFQK